MKDPDNTNIHAHQFDVRASHYKYTFGLVSFVHIFLSEQPNLTWP